MSWDMKTANDFMRRKLVTLSPETEVLDGVARLLKHSISGAPVTDDKGNYQGVFSEKCCMNALTETLQLANEVGMQIPQVREFMTRSLITLSPEADVFDAIDHILAKRISGAPVLNQQAAFLGIFSEKTAMRVLISAAYDQQPGTTISAYMNTDLRRVIHDTDSLTEIAQKFQQTPYRRLPVLDGQKLVGQVSRRDVIKSEYQIAQQVVAKSKVAGSDVRLQNSNCHAAVGGFMDLNAKIITSTDDILSIAQTFLNTPYRRLAVVESGKLIGQVSRRDLLDAAAALLRQKKSHKAKPLYISPLTDSAPPSIG